MFSRNHHRQFTLARLVALCALLLIVVLAAFKAAAPHSFAAGAAARVQQPLTFEARVATQRAIDEVAHRQRRRLPTTKPLSFVKRWIG